MEEQRDTCKVCGKEVMYLLVKTGVGKNGKEKTKHVAIHVGEPIPETGVEVSRDTCSSTNRNWMRKHMLVHDDTTTVPIKNPGKKVKVENQDPGTKALVLIHQTHEPKVHKKEIVTMHPDVSHESLSTGLREIRTIPEESVGKPVLDITGMQRNRFAITGAIANTLRASGMDEAAVNSVRNRLISAGKDFVHLINAGQIHVQFVEGGEPLGYI